MKICLWVTAICTSLIIPASALADDHSISVSYIRSNMLNEGHSEPHEGRRLDGFNIKYRYEWASPLSLLGSFSFMNANLNETHSVSCLTYTQARYQYSLFSLTAGLAWRFNEFLSLYELLGINYDNLHVDAQQYYKQSGNRQANTQNSIHWRKASIAYGGGLQINPVQNIVVDIGYEASRYKGEGMRISRNAWLIGVGYRF